MPDPTMGTPDPSAQPSPDVSQLPPSTPGRAVAPQVDAQAPPGDVHHSFLGKAVRGLFGNTVDYKVNPDTGKMESVPVSETPGSIFRHILAGAILGGAMGSGQRTFTKGALTGAGAEMQDQRQQDEVKQQRARQSFDDQLKAQKAQQEKQGFQTEQDYRKAMTAQANAKTLEENQLAQNESFTYYQNVAASGTAKLSPYKAAGIPLKFTDVPESDIPKLAKQNPGFTSLDWEPTGTKIVMKPDGTPSYQLTYSAVDANQKVKITPEFIKLLKDADMDKYNPDYFNSLKPGKELNPSEFIALKSQYQTMSNEKQARIKQNADVEEIQARTKEANARAAQAYAEAAKTTLDKNKQQEMDSALNELNTNKGDFSKLSPKSKFVIGESLVPLISANTAAIKDVVAQHTAEGTDPNKDPELEKLMQQRDGLLQLSGQAFTANAPAASSGMVTVTTSEGQTGQIPANQVDTFLRDNPGSKRAGTTSTVSNPNDALKNVPSNQTLLKGPGGVGVQQIPNDAVPNFLRTNPGYTVVGRGTQTDNDVTAGK